MRHPEFPMRRFPLEIRRLRGVLARSKRAEWLSDSSPLRSKDVLRMPEFLLCLPTLC
jgi:hypothetical protein